MGELYCTKTAVSIEMSFVGTTQVDPRNRALNGGPDLPHGNGTFEEGDMPAYYNPTCMNDCALFAGAAHAADECICSREC